MRIDHSRRSSEDLTEIWLYTTLMWSEEQADLYVENIIRTIEDLAQNKVFGRSYAQYYPNLQGISCKNHIIFYQIRDGGILIVRILHNRMDLGKHLKR